MKGSCLRYFGGYIIALATLLTGKIQKNIEKTLKGELILSIYFHNPTEKIFVGIIKWLKSKGLHFISADQLVNILESKVEFPKGAVYVSIDDGWRDNLNNIFYTSIGSKIPLTLFPTIEPMIENGGFWWSYIDTGISKGLQLKKKSLLKILKNKERIYEVEKAKKYIKLESESIDLESLRVLSKKENITIGCHTYSHPILTTCEDGELDFEIGKSREKLTNIINKEIRYFAYTNGIFKKREKDKVKQFGYRAGFGTNPELIVKESAINLYDIPRLEISDDMSMMENICRATGVWYSLNISKKDNA